MVFAKKHVKWAFLFILLAWSILWGFLVLPALFKYLVAHPNIPIPIAYLVHESGYWLSLFIASLLFIKKPINSLRFSLGVAFLLVVFEITSPPLCVSTAGNLLYTVDNPSCMMGNDSFMSWMWNIIGIPYGTVAMYYLTYVGGIMFFGAFAVIFLTKKELWSQLVNGIFGVF